MLCCSFTSLLVLLEQANIWAIAEFSMSGPTRDFFENADFHQLFCQRVCRWIRCADQALDLVYRHNWAYKQMLQHNMSVAARPPQMCSDRGAVIFSQRQNAARGVGCLSAHLGNALEEEFEPRFPCAFIARRL